MPHNALLVSPSLCSMKFDRHTLRVFFPWINRNIHRIQTVRVVNYQKPLSWIWGNFYLNLSSLGNRIKPSQPWSLGLSEVHSVIIKGLRKSYVSVPHFVPIHNTYQVLLRLWISRRTKTTIRHTSIKFTLVFFFECLFLVGSWVLSCPS